MVRTTAAAAASPSLSASAHPPSGTSPSQPAASTTSLTRVFVLLFAVFIAVMVLGSKSVGSEVAEHALDELRTEIAIERKKHAKEVAKLKRALDRVKSGKPADEPEEEEPDATTASSKKIPRPPTRRPARGAKTKKPAPTAAEVEGANNNQDEPTAPPAASDEAAGAASGDGDSLKAPEGSPESNTMPEDIHHPDERKFRHWIAELAELPDDAPEEAKQVHKALSMYNADRDSKTNIPVYGTACIGEVDCPYVKNQLKSLDTGVGHIVIVLNKDVPEFRDYFRKMEKLFPGRFTLAFRPEGGGCSESWNIMMRLGFAITPQPNFVMATNGDLWALPGYLAQFAKYMNDHLESQVGSRFVHFSSFALNKRGWEILGPFDEVIYPAYAEDVEYHIRAVSAGVLVGSFPGMAPDRSHKHAGSRSFADKNFNEKYQRWDKNDYMFRKWGVDMRHHTDFQHARPYKHPWNQEALTHRRSWVVDPAHRECIKTGNGIKHRANRGGCMLSSCNSCWYNASVLLPLLPPGTQLPDSITTQNRVRY